MLRSSLLLAGLLALGTGCASDKAPAPPDADGALAPFTVQPPPTFSFDGVRVATFNAEFLFDGEGDEGEASFAWKGDPAKARAHRDKVARVIRMLDADVVMLQEVENLSVLQMMIDESLQDLGYSAYLVDGADRFTGQDVGLLSKLPVDEVGRTDERVRVGDGERMYGVSKNVWARMDLAGLPTTLIGVHFLARPDDPDRIDRREAQAEVIRQLVEQEQALGRAVVVLGDFNDFDPSAPDRRASEPITDVLATIRSAGPSPQDDLVSLLGEVPQARRFTALYDRNRNDRVDEGELSAIDHILLDRQLYRKLRDVQYVHAHDPLDGPDHFPIVVTLADQ
jgi:endonuclease/exonuclease/phosphatase family metal-dependent hydrolase